MVGDGTNTPRCMLANAMEGQADVKVLGGSIKAFFQPQVNKKSLLIQPSAGDESAQSRCEQFIQEVTISGAGEKEATYLKERSCDLKGRKYSTQPKHTRPKWSLTCKVSSSSKWLSDSSSDFEDSVNSLSITETKQTQKRRKKKTQGKLECKSSAGREDGDKTRAVETPKEEVQECEADCIREGNKTFDVHFNHHSEPRSMKNVLGKEDKPKRTSAFDILMNSQKVQRVEDQRTEGDLIESPKAAKQLFDYKSNTLDPSLVSEDSETVSGSSKLNMDSQAESELVIAGDKLLNKIKPDCSETSAFDFLMQNAGKGKVDCSMELITQSETDSKDLRGSLRRVAKKKSFTFLPHSSKVKDASCLLGSQSKAADSQGRESEHSANPKAQKRKKKKMHSSMDEAVASSISETGKDVGVLKSRKERRRSKVSRQTRKTAGDKTSVLEGKEGEKGDVSSSNVSGTDQADKLLRKVRTTRSGRKSVPNSVPESRTTDTMSDQSSDSKDFEPIAKRARRKSSQKKKKKHDAKEDIEKKQKPKEKNSLESAAPQRLLPSDNHSLPDSKEEPAIAKDPVRIDQTEEKIQPTPVSSCSDNQVATDSSDIAKDEEESTVNGEEATASTLCKDPKNLAAMFLRKKPASTSSKTSNQSQETSPQTSVLYPTSPAGNTSTLMDIADQEEINNEANHSQRQEKSAVDNEATNKAFKALFTGACLQRTLSAPGRAVPLPAPLPSVSHVFQRGDADPVDSYFWNLPWPSAKPTRGVISDNWVHEDSMMPTLSTDFLPKETAYIFGRREEHFPYRPKRHKQQEEVMLEMFTEADVKKLLTELALFYPGVPLRKLYKRYKSKQENYKAINVLHENQKQTVEKNSLSDILEASVQPSTNSNKKEKDVKKECDLPRSRGKWKLSSDQEKKFARKVKDFIASESQETDQSANNCCKKRCREEDNQEPEHPAIKGRRSSRRLQKKTGTPNVSASVDSNQDKQEEPEGGSRRTKRRRTVNHQGEDDKTTVRQIPEQEMSCNMSAVCTTENKIESSVTKDTLWTELYRPLCPTEVMANASAVSKLSCWLEEWKIKREKTLRKELQQCRRLLANEKSSGGSSSRTSSQNVQWWDEDSDSDFQLSDASGDSDTEGDGLSTAMFISGPKGAGKTAMVYACAEELGYKVFEVNCASKRTGKQILSQLEEATQSHLVISNKPGTVNKDAFNQLSFTGLFNKSSDIPPSTSPLQAFMQPKEMKAVDKKVKRRGQSKSLKVKGKPLLKQSSPAGGIQDTKSWSNLSTKAASLILFEEVDIIFEEDKSFWMAVNSFMQNAKCPIVLISTEASVDCEGKYECINLKQPSVNLLSGHLQLVALVNNIFVNPDDLKSLVAVNNCDIRKSMMALQFWVESGGGVMMQYKRPSNVEQNGSNSSTVLQNSQHISNNKNQPAYAAASLGLALDNEAAVISGILDNAGEESIFLSLSDWQAIKSRGGNGLQTSGTGIPEQGHTNSDFDTVNPKRRMLIGTNGSTDSIYEINTDTSDSQQSASSSKEVCCVEQLPVCHGLLFESAHGLLNCVADFTKSSLSVLQTHHPGDSVKRTFNAKLHLTHFTQAMGADVIQSNLNDLVPLFINSPNMAQVRCKQDQHTGTCQDKPTEDCKGSMTVNLFSDSSLFDDGTGVSENKEQLQAFSSYALPNGLGLDEPQKRTGASFQHFTDAGITVSQLTDRGGEGGQCEGRSTVLGSEGGSQITQKERCSQEKKWTSQALEVFQQFAETMSFTNAFCPSFPNFNAISTSHEFGWWNASVKPGLTDKHVTVRETADWLTRDTRASIRGALEVACLESSHVKVESLAESMEKIVVSSFPGQGTESCDNSPVDKPCKIDVLAENLPLREPNSVLRFTTCNATETSGSLVSRRKLYRSLSSSIPTVHYCNHRCVVSDYLPTLRLLCHTERMREAANLKRRFLHYLDSISFPLSQSTKSALADSYMAS